MPGLPPRAVTLGLIIALLAGGALGAGLSGPPLSGADAAKARGLAIINAGATDDRVVSQTRAAFDGVPAADLSKVAIAYEPIWAIGTGQSCEPDEANRVMATIRHAIGGLDRTPILYGGSMTAANVASYMKYSDINGGLVGGASLDPEGFAALIERAVSVSS